MSGRVDQLRQFAAFASGLWRYLGTPMTVADAKRRVEAHLAGREERFLALLRDAVFAPQRGPYRALFGAASVEQGDVARLVRQDGLAEALAQLYDAGVYVSHDEFKGRVPIVRPGLELHVEPADFDNPLAVGHYETRTGGSRGEGRPMVLGFDLIEHDTAYHALFLDAFGLWERPTAIWYPPLPGIAGIKGALANAKLGRRVERWFGHVSATEGASARAMVHAATTALAQARRRPVPRPVETPADRAVEVATWLAEKRREGRPGLLHSTPSSGVRVCRAALDAGLDISGSFFRFGGEPFTPGKEAAVRAAGAEAACHYLIGETGLVGAACASREHLDEVHLALDKVAVVQRPTQLGSGESAAMLAYTTLLPGTSKLLLNVASDDFGLVAERSCGCLLDRLGLALHLHGIRSEEKLTGEGVSVLGTELHVLVEEVLPARFGGAPTDYQLVEQERDGLPRVFLIVSPRVGPLDEGAAVEATLAFLAAAGPRQALTAALWESAGTLGVERVEPHITFGSKVAPLHVRSPV
jgi:hypothetical protein